MNGEEKQKAGCIVSFENEVGQTFTIHRVGPIKQGVRDACRIARTLDPSFRVVAVSTPSSIFTDLQGARLPQGQMRAGAHRWRRNPTPESTLCGAIGEREMLHPRLRDTARG